MIGETYDVIVVGGGPAGSTTALLLAREGYSVALLERQTFPRSKPCGDCLSPGANPILRRIGLLHAVVDAQPARLTGWRLSAGPTACFDSTFEDGSRSISLSRDRFDRILLESAQAVGADIHERTRLTSLVRSPDGRVLGVTAERDGEKYLIKARLVVGADGLRSRVARALGAYARTPRLRKISLTAHLRDVPAVGTLGEMHVRGNACLGIAPVTADRSVCNVTVVAAKADPANRGSHALMRATLARFPERDLSASITDDTEILASGPFDWPTKRIAFAGAALVGDAAGYYDPFTGQGIYQSLAGAEMLAEHAGAYLQTGRTADLDSYEKRLRALTGPARRLQRAIEFACARPQLADRIFRKLSRASATADRLVAVIGDLRPARDLLSPALLARLLL